jgi:hypothetical protein
MRTLWLGFILGLVLAGGANVAHAEKAAVTKEAALKAIQTFIQDPASKEGFAASDVFMAYAKSSKQVHISISKAVIPWMKGKDAEDYDTRKILYAAYIAGNLEVQLKSGAPKDDVYAGWSQVLSTYAQLLHINSAAKISEVEDLKKKEVAGTLREYAAEVAKD